MVTKGKSREIEGYGINTIQFVVYVVCIIDVVIIAFLTKAKPICNICMIDCVVRLQVYMQDDIYIQDDYITELFDVDKRNNNKKKKKQ